MDYAEASGARGEKVIKDIANVNVNSLLTKIKVAKDWNEDVDSVIASEFCKPGDLIRARVVALGRSGFYAQLSTAEEGMGIVRLEKC